MTIRRILLPLPGTASTVGEIETGLAVTKALGAHIEALYISPAAGGPSYDMGRMTHVSRAAAAEPIDFGSPSDRKKKELQSRFTESCVAAGVALLSPNDGSPGPLTASWRESEGPYVKVAVQRAAGFDLVIAASASLADALKAIAESELIQTGRPVLLAPGRLTTKWTDPAMIAWKDSPECWRAVSAAIPLLQIAKSVKIVNVTHDGQRDKMAQTDLLAYLQCHGIEATSQILRPDVRSVGDALMAAAASDECGLMVMGAFSHGRFREILKKGTTYHILHNSSARPVLMMH